VFAPTTRKTFLCGALVSIALLFALRLFINRAPVADWIIAPLLMKDEPAVSDAIVVLGAGVLEGCVPNLNGVRRTLLAARLWHAGKAPVVVFTGHSGGGCPVARAMALLAEEMGVPAAAIRQETASTSTWENATMVAPLLRGWGIQNILLVTDRLHMRRASGAFDALGFAVHPAAVPIAEGHEDNVSMLTTGLREFAALGYYRMRGWIGSPGPVDQAAAPPTAPARKPVGVGPVVVLGASYAQGWTVPDIGGVPVVNKAVGGAQTADMVARFDAEVVTERPRVVILWGFINDVTRAPAGALEPALTTVRENYAEMIARARQHGIEPVLSTELTLRPPAGSRLEPVIGLIGRLRGKEGYQDVINRHVLGLNQWMAETAAREGLLLLQFQAVLSEPNGRRRLVFAESDGSHVTEAGYEALTAYALPLLEEFIVAR
jgi:uncharacterized SAM-binding protein YcdF (DUF218 family)/lysophospholipase L1-like esterase